MYWTSLGHAGWLVEAGGLRLVCDPLIEVDHHGGVFEVTPRRRIHAAGLRADFLLISHRHPDHFDVRSLAALAALDPDTVVLTPDPLVVWAAGKVGFRQVRLVRPGELVELDGLRFVTTESIAPDEWGVMMATDDGVVWNQVDTVLRDPGHVREVARPALAALSRSHVEVVLAQWQPMLEIAVQLGEATKFPDRAYAALLDKLAAVEAGVIVPASAGTVHARPYEWLDEIVNPVEPSRFVRDAQRRCPDARILTVELGAGVRVRAGEVGVERSEQSLVERIAGGPERGVGCFAIPPVTDPQQFLGDYVPSKVVEDDLLEWLEHQLGPALVARFSEFGVADPLRFAIEIVFSDRSVARTLIVGPAEFGLHEGIDADWDVSDVAAATMLWEVVVAGRRHWGDLLLSAGLRGRSRAHRIDARGLTPANLATMFLYYALSYEESVERATRWEVGRALGRG